MPTYIYSSLLFWNFVLIRANVFLFVWILIVGLNIESFISICLEYPIFIFFIFNPSFPVSFFSISYPFFILIICNDVGLDHGEFRGDEFSFCNRPASNGIDRDGPVLSKLGSSSSTTELHPKTCHVESTATAMPPASVMTRLILIMVWRKLIRNPNTYSSLIGLTWSLVSFK